VDARAIDVSERALGREPHTPYADPSRPPADGLQTDAYWSDSSSSNVNNQEAESRSAKGTRAEGLFSMDMDIEGEDQDDDDELDEDLDDYFWDGSSSSSSSASQMDRAGRDVDPYRITIEPQYYSQDLFDYREEEDDEVEENEGEDGLRSGGINMITRFREEIEEAFDEEDEDEDEDMDMGAIDDEGDYVGFWHGDRRSPRSHRRRQGLGLSLRGSTGGSNHGRQAWKINDNDWEEDLDGVLSLENMVDRVQDVEHVHASSAAKTKEGAGGFRRLFPLNW